MSGNPATPPLPPDLGAADVQKLLRALPSGTILGLEELTSHDYWSYVLKQAEIDVSNDELLKYRFTDIGSHFASRLAFLAGSGEYASFNARYLISNIVEQCAEMHHYTRRLEKYCVKLQQRLAEQQAQQQQQQQAPSALPPPPQLQLHPVGGSDGAGGAPHQEPAPQRPHHHQQQQHHNQQQSGAAKRAKHGDCSSEEGADGGDDSLMTRM